MFAIRDDRQAVHRRGFALIRRGGTPLKACKPDTGPLLPAQKTLTRASSARI